MASAVVPTPIPLKQQPQQPKQSPQPAFHSPVQLHQNLESGAISSPSPVSAYTIDLEYLVSEVMGSEAVVKARAAHPTLTFSNPPPENPNATDLNKVCSFPLFKSFFEFMHYIG